MLPEYRAQTWRPRGSQRPSPLTNSSKWYRPLLGLGWWRWRAARGSARGRSGARWSIEYLQDRLLSLDRWQHVSSMLKQKQRHVNLTYNKNRMHDATNRVALALYIPVPARIRSKQESDRIDRACKQNVQQNSNTSRNNQPEQSDCMNASRQGPAAKEWWSDGATTTRTTQCKWKNHQV